MGEVIIDFDCWRTLASMLQCNDCWHFWRTRVMCTWFSLHRREFWRRRQPAVHITLDLDKSLRLWQSQISTNDMPWDRVYRSFALNTLVTVSKWFICSIDVQLRDTEFDNHFQLDTISDTIVVQCACAIIIKCIFILCFKYIS